jgi:hypothetical protein
MNSQIIIIFSGLIPGVFAGIFVVVLLRAMHRPKLAEDSIKNTTFVFSGNLKQTSLLDAIQFLEIGRREGILHIYCGRRKGYLIFQKGQIIDAFYRNQTGKEATFVMLSLDEGDFYFEPKLIQQPRIISESIMDLAFEWDALRGGEAASTGK